MKKWIIAVALTAVTLALGSGIKVWSSGEAITYTDLNANFQHLHTNLGHAHGAVVTNADISTSAGIASSKLADYRLLPRAWGALDPTANCTSGTCSIYSSKNVTSIVRGGLGSYTVTLNYTAANTPYDVVVSTGGGSQVSPNDYRGICQWTSSTATTFNVLCKGWPAFNDGGASEPKLVGLDLPFSFSVFDND